MTNYRRAWRPGATWFFTVNLDDRRSSLLVDRIDDLRDAFRYVLGKHPLRIDALCVLPDHLHAVWTLPPGDADFALRWRLVKTHFFPGKSREARRQDRAASERASAASGNAGIGSIEFAMWTTCSGIWTTPISTR